MLSALIGTCGRNGSQGRADGSFSTLPVKWGVRRVCQRSTVTPGKSSIGVSLHPQQGRHLPGEDRSAGALVPWCGVRDQGPPFTRESVRLYQLIWLTSRYGCGQYLDRVAN
jgi:hypothetical protein